MKTLFFFISIHFIYPQDIDHKEPIDMVSNTISLGRNKDPRLPSDISKFSLIRRKATWSLLTAPGIRFLSKFIYPKSTISHFDVDGAVAFTIDDGFCGADNFDGCMIEEVRQLFKRYNAKATFFITGSHVNSKFKIDIDSLINDGHELVNHNMMDWPYTSYSSIEFNADLDETESILSQYRLNPPRWYRAPFGKLNKTMQQVLDNREMIHVVCDAFANDTAIPDSEWIASFILKKVKPGSIVLIHMPEKGVREWNFKALELTLEGLHNRGLKILTLTEMSNLEKN